MGKLPYIPDKKMYAAVMGACRYVRDTGYFNRATSYYADKYGVDVAKVREYVRMAQSNGQKAASKKKTRKYHWFAVEYSMGNERNGCDCFDPWSAQYCVRKGLSCESVQRTMSAKDDYLSEYSLCHWFGRVKQFETEEEARTTMRKWQAEDPVYKERLQIEQMVSHWKLTTNSD